MTRDEVAAVVDDVARYPGAHSVGIYDKDGELRACYGSVMLHMGGRERFVDFVLESVNVCPGGVAKVVQGEPLDVARRGGAEALH